MYLVDTNTVSDAHKGIPEPVSWLASVDPDLVYVSVITLGEIRRGIEMVRATRPRKAFELELWLASIRRDNADRILPVTEEVATEWGRISAIRKRGDAYGLIAATALVYRMTVVTRNVADFAGAGVPVIDPWRL
ncbi:MAG: type II toxin-antitoxin system VapC family toxin [Rhizobiaceae bacterium]|nr:type II toxin-antitoxin system VapC family toxin [Rhizobiaceae bacterium]MCV0407345.1 type II toxin-antitoxin system VapC family toxin [Rhizobiaceae bacterium]